MNASDSMHYLMGLADAAPGGTGAAIGLAVKRMVDAGDNDGLDLMAMHARLAEMEHRLHGVLRPETQNT